MGFTGAFFSFYIRFIEIESVFYERDGADKKNVTLYFFN